MADRIEQTIRLLQTSTDHLPLPRARDTATVSGFVHRSVQVDTCPDCLANGRVLKTCETCHGRGVLEQPRARDPYDKGEGGGFIDSLHLDRRERDAELARLASQTREPYASAADELADANQHPYGWERARRRMFQLYDYRPLQLAVDALRVADGPACHVVHAVYVYAVWDDLSNAVRSVADRGVSFLERRLPDPIRAPGDTAPPPAVRVSVARLVKGKGPGPRARMFRDAELRRLAREGESPADLAAQFDLSVQHVYRIVNA